MMNSDDKENSSIGRDGLGEGISERPRRRRRSQAIPEDSGTAFPEAPAAEGTPEPVNEAVKEEPAPAEEPVAQRADSRVPPEARRMTASPYGIVPPRRPGTRPVQAVRRPAAETGRPVPENVRHAKGRTDVFGTEHTRSFDAIRENGPSRMGETTRVSVGYAPGRMNLSPRTAQEYTRDIRTAQEHSRDPRSTREIPDNRYSALRMDDRLPERQGRRHPVMWGLTTALLVIGLLLVIFLALPEGNGIRDKAADVARTVTNPVKGFLEKKEEPIRIDSFSVTGNEGKPTAPIDVIFSATTDKTVTNLRLTDEDGRELEAGQTKAENSENTAWTLTFRVRDGYEGIVKLQAAREGSQWMDTEYSASLEVAPPLAATPTPEPAEIPAGENPDGQGTEPAGEPETPAGEEPETAVDPESGKESGSGEIPENFGDDMWGVSWGQTDYTAEITPEPTPAPTDTPEPTPEPTPTPPLEAVADPGADPALIVSTTVYDGSKKVKNYVRAAKSLIHMPPGDEYTPAKIGVLTFRGNAFRQNAAVGTVSSVGNLTQLWQVEAGSSRGATQTYYGYEWTGQPAIVKWSSQVRTGSNIDEEKRTKTALREVIIAGVDGVIRFLDLEDGVVTRSAINVGYPMKGTPSLHPAGYPYMNVGQYTRKMKNKTGTIGLRQFNLYTQKEQKLIDGLDGKLHRGINRYGSFETSALIDRTSDTVITLGTNGLLYLTSLNTAFDYQAATLSISPGSIVMASKAKGQSKAERVAVESSHAMYDRYVFYADMGGVLRCVDTNFLAPVWAVQTGDSVLAAIALDQSSDTTLDLYTANMLSLRKSGPAQIRRYDALSGREIWKLEIDVAKNTKTKEEAGVKASPVIGQNRLKEIVYFTVTGLNDAGCGTLGVADGTKAALVAIDKESGEVRWAKALSDRSESSPVAVYDAEGNGWIIQCAENGEILMMEGITGKVVAETRVEARIQASPAVYNDIMVIGTTGKGTEYVMALKIH